MVQSIDDVRRRQHGGRVPPHSIQAEESLLGAMLLSRDAIAAAVEVVSADDFYKPAHGHVYDAITALFGQGEPVDPVTVADQLRRAGLLDAVGGPAALVTLQAGTPAVGSASRYGRIVEEHAMLRRLIGVAGEIAGLMQRLAARPSATGTGTLLDETTIYWFNRHGDGNAHADCNRNCYIDGDSDVNRHGDRYGDIDSHTNRHRKRDGDGNRNRYPDRDCHSDGESDGYGFTDTHADADIHADTDAHIHADIHANADRDTDFNPDANADVNAGERGNCYFQRQC